VQYDSASIITIALSVYYNTTFLTLTFVCMYVYPSGKGPAYSGPLQRVGRQQAHCINPGGEESG